MSAPKLQPERCAIIPPVALGEAPNPTHAGVTSENVATRYGISRQQQDEMAARSHARAAKARASGRFKDEIVPVKTIIKDKEVRSHLAPGLFKAHGRQSHQLGGGLPQWMGCGMYSIPALPSSVHACADSRPSAPAECLTHKARRKQACHAW